MRAFIHSGAARDFVKQLLTVNPDKRLTAAGAVCFCCVYPNLSMYLVYARHHNPPQVPLNTCGSHHKRGKLPANHCHRRKDCAKIKNLLFLSMMYRRHQQRMKHRRHQKRQNKCNIRILCDGLVNSIIYLLSRCLCFRLTIEISKTKRLIQLIVLSI